jgi:hypothetical protein
MLQNRNTCVNKDKVAELVPAYNPLTNGQCAMVVRCVTLTTIKNSELQGTSFCIFNFNHYFIAGALILTNTCQWHRSNPDAALAKAHQGPISSERWSDEHMTSGMLCSKSPGRRDCVDFAGVNILASSSFWSFYFFFHNKIKMCSRMATRGKLSDCPCICPLPLPECSSCS